MSSVPNDTSAMPGEDTGNPDQSAVDQVNSAINQGYSYADVVAYHDDNNLPPPPQPSLDAIMSDTTDDASQWSAPDAQGGANPYTLDTPEQARGLIDQLATSGAGIGAVEEVGAAVGSTVRSMVQASTEELQGAMTPLDLAVERGASTVQRIVGNKWIRRGLGAAAAEAAFNNPGGGASGR